MSHVLILSGKNSRALMMLKKEHLKKAAVAVFFIGMFVLTVIVNAVTNEHIEKASLVPDITTESVLQ